MHFRSCSVAGSSVRARQPAPGGGLSHGQTRASQHACSPFSCSAMLAEALHSMADILNQVRRVAGGRPGTPSGPGGRAEGPPLLLALGL